MLPERRARHFFTYQGRTLTLRQWAEVTGIGYHTLYRRLVRRGWPVEEALARPVANTGRGSEVTFYANRLNEMIADFLRGGGCDVNKFVEGEELQRLVKRAGLELDDVRARLQNLAVLAEG